MCMIGGNINWNSTANHVLANLSDHVMIDVADTIFYKALYKATFHLIFREHIFSSVTKLISINHIFAKPSLDRWCTIHHSKRATICFEIMHWYVTASAGPPRDGFACIEFHSGPR